MAKPELRDHRKFLKLRRLLNEPTPHVIGYLECLWSRGYQTGNPHIGDADDVEAAAEYPGERGRFVAAAVAAGLVDVDADGRHKIHDLFDHAPRYAQKRMARKGTAPDNAMPSARTQNRPNRVRADTKPPESCPRGPHNQEPRTKNQEPRTKEEKSTESPEPAKSPASVPNESQPMLAGDLFASANATGPQIAQNGPPIADLGSTGTESRAANASSPKRNLTALATTEPPAMEFPAVGDQKRPNWPLSQAKLDEYRAAFPGLDVLAELRRARQWLLDNPTRRKTHAGMTKFLGGWLGRANDRAPPGRDRGFKTRGEAESEYAANVLINAIGGPKNGIEF